MIQKYTTKHKCNFTVQFADIIYKQCSISCYRLFFWHDLEIQKCCKIVQEHVNKTLRYQNTVDIMFRNCVSK